MADMERHGRDILSEFWAPVCAVGGHGGRGPNAQICVSVLGASVVPEQPRLLVALWKDNYTHELVTRNASMAITVLSEGDAWMVERLGMRSGRDEDKLGGTGYRITSAGDPFFPSGAGFLACGVLEEFDLGDATAFLVAVDSRERTRGKTPLTRDRMHALLGDDFSRRWAAMAAGRAAVYRERMRWQ